MSELSQLQLMLRLAQRVQRIHKERPELAPRDKHPFSLEQCIEFTDDLNDTDFMKVVCFASQLLPPTFKL